MGGPSVLGKNVPGILGDLLNHHLCGFIGLASAALRDGGVGGEASVASMVRPGLHAVRDVRSISTGARRRSVGMSFVMMECWAV